MGSQTAVPTASISRPIAYGMRRLGEAGECSAGVPPSQICGIRRLAKASISFLVGDDDDENWCFDLGFLPMTPADAQKSVSPR